MKTLISKTPRSTSFNLFPIASSFAPSPLRGSLHFKPAARLIAMSFGFAFCLLTLVAPARANPTQEDVFKSIQSNVDDKMDGRKVLAFFAAASGFVILVVLLNNRQQKPLRPKILNHQAKLLRELMKTAGLKSSQVRQLKMLSADLRENGEPVENLVTLLLCPSLIQKAQGGQGRLSAPPSPTTKAAA